MALHKMIPHALLVMLLALTGCGGGSSSDSEPVPIDDGDQVQSADIRGVWTGSGDAAQKVLATTLSDSSSWFLIMDEGYIPRELAVFTLTPDSETLTYAGDGTLYSLAPAAAASATVSGSFLEKESLQAAMKVSPNTTDRTFNLTYAQSFEEPVTLSDVAGIWVADYGVEGRVTVDMTEDGDFVAFRENNPFCDISGQLTERAEPALFDVIFDERACGGNLFEGIGFLARFTDPVTEQALPERDRIYFLLTTPEGAQGAVFMGERGL